MKWVEPHYPPALPARNGWNRITGHYRALPRRNVEASLGRVKEASGKVAAAVGWESTLRKELQEKSEEQALILVALRGTALAQYVEPDMENLGLQAVDVRTAPVMLQRSELVSDRFEAPNLAKMLGQARFENPVDLKPYVEQLRESAKDLAALIARVNEAVRRTDRARQDRLLVRDEHHKVVLRSARVFEDFCRLAGDDALADKVRRTVRASPSRPDPGDGEGGDVTEPIGDVDPTPVGEDDASQEG